MHSLSLQTVLWFGAQILQLAILVCMYRRRIQEYYPAFFYYIILQVLSDPFLTLAQDRWPYTYYFGYWIDRVPQRNPVFLCSAGSLSRCIPAL